MEYSTTVDLLGARRAGWKVLRDVRRWRSGSARRAGGTQPGPAARGQTVARKQPGREVAHYEIDVVDAGALFRWGSNQEGVRQAADHLVTPTGANSCRVMLTFAMSGPLGAVLGALGASKIRGMVDAEAAALASWLRPAGDATSA